jgi:hypothetical protein
VLARAGGTAGYLDRFNLATGAVTRGAPVYVSATAQLVTVGDQLGFANGPACTTGCMPSLDTLRTFSFVNLHALTPTRPPDIVPANAVFAAYNSVPAAYCMPQSCATPGGISSEPGQVWIGTGADVELINLSPIETPVLHNTPLRGPIHVPGGQVVALAVSPNCHYLYVAVQARTGAVGLVELNAVTGGMMAAKLRLPAVGDVHLQPVPGGIWISYRGGMDGAAYLYSAARLQPIVPPISKTVPAGAPQAGQSVGMGVVPAAVPPAVFLTSDLGLTCVVPSSGRALAGEAYAPSSYLLGQPFAARHLILYASGATASGQAGIIAVTTPASCWSAGEP